jgi:alpha-galactosidase
MDPIDRLAIQRGTSFFYPASSMGAHVADFRVRIQGHLPIPLQTGATVAMAGRLGYALDLTTLTSSELDRVRAQIDAYKSWRDLVLTGQYHRLEVSPPPGVDVTVWQVVSPDRQRTLVSAVCGRTQSAAGPVRARLRGLDPGLAYQVDGQVRSGASLMEAGLVLIARPHDAAAVQLHIRAAS